MVGGGVIGYVSHADFLVEGIEEDVVLLIGRLLNIGCLFSGLSAL